MAVFGTQMIEIISEGVSKMVRPRHFSHNLVNTFFQFSGQNPAPGPEKGSWSAARGPKNSQIRPLFEAKKRAKKAYFWRFSEHSHKSSKSSQILISACSSFLRTLHVQSLQEHFFLVFQALCTPFNLIRAELSRVPFYAWVPFPSEPVYSMRSSYSRFLVFYKVCILWPYSGLHTFIVHNR